MGREQLGEQGGVEGGAAPSKLSAAYFRREHTAIRDLRCTIYLLLGVLVGGGGRWKELCANVPRCLVVFLIPFFSSC